jgi:hypothetical protein
MDVPAFGPIPNKRRHSGVSLPEWRKDIVRYSVFLTDISGERTNFASSLQYAVFLTNKKQIPRRIHETT